MHTDRFPPPLRYGEKAEAGVSFRYFEGKSMKDKLKLFAEHKNLKITNEREVQGGTQLCISST